MKKHLIILTTGKLIGRKLWDGPLLVELLLLQ